MDNETPAELTALVARINEARALLKEIERAYNETAEQRAPSDKYAELERVVRDAHQFAMSALRDTGSDFAVNDLHQRWTRSMSVNGNVAVQRKESGEGFIALCPGLDAVEAACEICIDRVRRAAQERDESQRKERALKMEAREAERDKEERDAKREAAGRRQAASITLLTSLATIVVTSLAEPCGDVTASRLERDEQAEVVWSQTVQFSDDTKKVIGSVAADASCAPALDGIGVAVGGSGLTVFADARAPSGATVCCEVFGWSRDVPRALILASSPPLCMVIGEGLVASSTGSTESLSLRPIAPKTTGSPNAIDRAQ